MKQLISDQSALSSQLEGLMEMQAAHTALLEETIQAGVGCEVSTSQESTVVRSLPAASAQIGGGYALCPYTPSAY